MSSETRLRSKDSQDMSQDSKSDQDRKGFNRKHNVRLHDAGGKDYLISSWVVVRLTNVSFQESRRCNVYTHVETTNIDSICRHSPFVTIRRFTQGRPFALYSELSNGKCVSEKGLASDIDICVVFFKGSRVADIGALCGVAYLLYDVVD